MLRAAVCVALATGLVVGLAICGSALGDQPHAAPWWHGLRPVVGQSVHGISYGPPGPARYPQHRGGNYPWYGYGFGVPTYNWGYFGAHGHGTLLTGFHGYHEDFWQFSWQRGY